MPDTDGGVLSNEDEYVDLEFYTEVDKYIKKDIEAEIKDMEKQIHEFHKLYRKHAFDDDQTICKNYHEMILGLKSKIKEISGKSK